MSVKASAAVWDMDLPPNKKLILLALADHADHEGKNVYPGNDLLVKKTGLCKRQVQRILALLEKSRHIKKSSGGSGRSNKASYEINLIKGDIVSPFREEEKVTFRANKRRHFEQQKVTSDPLKGDISSIPPTPPYKENHHEPKKNHVGTMRAPAREKLPKSFFSDSFDLTEQMIFYAQGLGEISWTESEIRLETEQFKDNAKAKAVESADWDASWRGWMRNAIVKGWGIGKGQTAKPEQVSITQQRMGDMHERHQRENAEDRNNYSEVPDSMWLSGLE